DHSLDLRGQLGAVAVARDGERERRGPAPARLEDRRIEHRLHQRLAYGLRVQIAEHFVEREGMHRPEREDERLLARRGLQLEVEALAEFLPERQAPGLVDAAAKGRVQHELHAARFVEEALEDERL